MPVYQITAPDGRTFKVTAPEGATREQALERVKAQYAAPAQPQPPQQPADPMLDPTGSFGENLAAGFGKALVDIKRGAVDLAGDAAGALTGSRPEFALRNDAEIAESRRLDAPLMRTGGGLTGNIVGHVAPALAATVIPGVNTVAGAGLLGATLGGLEPTMAAESRMGNMALGGLLGAGGQKAANVVGDVVANRAARRAVTRGANESRDRIIREGIEAGYRFDPLHTNPEEIGLATKAARTFSGMRASESMLSTHNQNVTNRLAKQAVGLAEDADLETALPRVVSDALDDYNALDDALRAAGTVKTHPDSLKKLNTLLKDYDDLVEEAPDLLGGNKAVEGVKALVDKGEFQGKNMIRLVRRLREKAKNDFKAMGDDAKKEAARIERAAADALEDMMERTVAESADPAALTRFKEARKRLAKAYDIEAAMDAGNVNAAKLARMAAKGSPLTDELKLIADMGEHFGRTTQVIKNARDPYSTLETGFTAGGLAMTEPGLVALGLARPVVRAGLLSPMGQKATVLPKYAPRAGERGAALLATPAGQALLRSAGPGLLVSGQ